MPIATTLNRIRACAPCREGWSKLLDGLGKTRADDEPLLYSRIVEINGIDDALWACRVEPRHNREWRLFAVWCARRVEHLMDDPRSVAAINVSERFAHGMAREEELDAAWRAAWEALAAWDAAAAGAGDAAWDAAWDAQTAKFLEIVGG